MKWQTLKWLITAPLAFLSGLFGWCGWLLLILVLCSSADWITGSAVAFKQGKWSSQVARNGICGKIGMYCAIIVAGVFDCLVYLVTNHLPMLQLPFSYTTLFLPIVSIWYICTELGSLLENAGGLGAPIPGFLTKAIALLKNKAEE